MITMFDSSHADTIPADAKFVAGYIDGSNSLASVRQKAPHATSMSIAIHAKHDADCLDVEPQCADVDEVTDWLTRQHARGVARPVIYADISHMKLVLAALERAHVARSSVRLWSAHYLANQNVPNAQLQAFAHICGPHTCGQLPIDMDGTQFTSQSRGVSLDESRLVDNFFGPPSPPPTPFVSDGSKSLGDLGTQFHNAVSTMLRLTAENSPGAVFRPGMAAYLNEVFAADKEKVPEGVIVFHSDGNVVKDFTCSGHQTLQGLALSFGCQPSAIVRLTAENSPGAVFSGAMADYLNDVFGRSTIHVPSGVHLFHQK